MKSLISRRTSTAADQRQSQQEFKARASPRDSHVPRSPPSAVPPGHARPGRSSTVPNAMPDLRFSRLDLEPKQEDGFGGFIEDTYSPPMSPPRQIGPEPAMGFQGRRHIPDGRLPQFQYPNGRNDVRPPPRPMPQQRGGFSTSADAYLRGPPPRQFSDTASLAPSTQSRQSRETNTSFWSSAQYYASPPQPRYQEVRPAYGKQQVLDSATQAMHTIDAPVKAPARHVHAIPSGPHGMMLPPPPPPGKLPPLPGMRGLPSPPPPVSPGQRQRVMSPQQPDSRSNRIRGEGALPPARDDMPQLRNKTSNGAMSDSRSVASASTRPRAPEPAMPASRLHNGVPKLDLRLEEGGWKLQKSGDEGYEQALQSVTSAQPPRKSSRERRLQQAPEVRRPDDLRLNEGIRVTRQPMPEKTLPSPRAALAPAASPKPPTPTSRQAPSRTRSGERLIAPDNQRQQADALSVKSRKSSRDTVLRSNDEQYVRSDGRSEGQGPAAPRTKSSREKMALQQPPASLNTSRLPGDPRARQEMQASNQRRQMSNAPQQPTGLPGPPPPRSSVRDAKMRNTSAPPVTTSKSPRRGNAAQMNSSSDGDNTTASSIAGQRQSQDSDTTPEDVSTDGEYRDAQTMPIHARARPRRDAERIERARSRRISGALDLDIAAQAVNGQSRQDGQHAHSDSKGSNQSAFTATLRQGGKDGAKSAEPTIADQRSVSQTTMAERPPPPKREPEPPKVPAIELAQRETKRMVAAMVAANKRSSSSEQQTLLKRIRDRMPAMTERKARVDMVDAGMGWHCLGMGDIMTWEMERKHWRKVREVRMVKRESKQALSFLDEKPAEELFEARFDVYYNDLFELMWSSTTPDVSERILSHVDVADVRSLRQVSRAVRAAIGTHQECVVVRALEAIGYRPWSADTLKSNLLRLRYITPHQVKDATPASAGPDPCPISTDDLEAFLLSGDLLEEYPLVARDYVANPSGMDRAIPQLARASTRAYNRVLVRLKSQPDYKAPVVRGADSKSTAKAAGLKSPLSGSPRSSIMSGNLRTNNAMQSLHAPSQSRDSGFSSSSPKVGQNAASRPGSLMQSPMTARTSSPALSLSGAPMLPDFFSSANTSPQLNTSTSNSTSIPESSQAVLSAGHSSLKSPYKPGRAPVYRVWVPPQDPTGWLSDLEIASCEEELFKSGIWHLLKKGDIVWDVAVGQHLNEGKFVFDGHFLRDLSYAYDTAGHLPSWLNVVVFSPSYWHNVIVASSPQPIVHFDISPWRDEVLSSLRLQQDQVESIRSNGARYRVAKWIYRASANINSGQIISKMNMPLEVVDEGWKGRIVIEMEGTAEAAKLLVERCAGNEATLRDKRALLANVMGGDLRAASKMLFTTDPFANGDGTPNGISANNAKYAARVGEVQTAPWAIMRERSRPGLIWLRPVSPRERIMA